MSIKDWKDKELNGLLNERWGFSMNLNKLNEGKDKKPDADGDGVPDYADKKPGKDDHAENESDDKPKKKTKKESNKPFLKKDSENTETTNESSLYEGEKKEFAVSVDGLLELMAAIGKIPEDDIARISQEIDKMKKENEKDSPMDMKERKLREAIRKIIKTKFNKRKK